MSKVSEQTGVRGRFALWAFIAWLAVTAMWWALAFAPLPVPSEWLAAARSVCFGSQPNGLPEPWGWAALIASPLSMLAFLLAVWGRELAAELTALWRVRLGKVALLALAAVPLLGMGWVGERVALARQIESAATLETLPAELPAAYPRSDEAAPALGLVNQDGEIVELTDFAGRPVLMTFAFAHCKTVCPVVVHTVRTAAEELPELDPAVVVVTLDPWRDTPSSLPTLVKSWKLEGRESHVLSGEVDQVLAVLQAWNVPWQRDELTGDVTHPALIRVVGADGGLGYAFNGPPVDWVVAAAERLAVPTVQPGL